MGDLDRISFGTDGWRDDREAFTDTRVDAVGDAFVRYLVEAGHDDAPIAVGYDARPGAKEIGSRLADRATYAGFDVWFAPRDTPTPAIAAAIDSFDLAGGFMVTASHNPPEYHGIKLIPAGGAPAVPSVTDRVAETLGDGPVRTPASAGSVDDFDFIEFHIELVLDRIDASLDGMSVVYDAMHGSGRGVTDTVLEESGAEVTRLRCDRSADFGGSPPEPTESHLSELIELVVEGDAAFGIANDGDADRVAIVTEEGYVDPNLLFAVLYEHLLETDSGPAVRTVSTTSLIDRIATAHGEDIIETPVGFKWVAEAIGEHDALIGGEDSNGLTIRGHVREKDGVLVGLLAAAVHASRPFDERIDALFEQYGTIAHVTKNVDCPEAGKEPVLEAMATDSPDSFDGIDVVSTSDVDGRKFTLADGSWVLVRPSGTEAKLRVYAEATDAARTEAISADAADHLRQLVESVDW